ncbi:UNVERIFIED_CONTAM: hypothetical protein GTU68_031290 [Idotea baltica]|nr:hypothetical protein [Idotea baltica]
MSCHYCGKLFRYQSQLEIHLRTHTGERPYVCEVCNQSFIHRHHLKRHNEKFHPMFTPHVCKLCWKSFKRKDHLVEHVRTHTGEKPYMCNICPKRFAKKSNLNAHTRCHVYNLNKFQY